MERMVVIDEMGLRRIISEVVQEEMGKALSTLTKISDSSPALRNIDEPLISREEMAAFLKITLPTLTDWVKRGLPKHKRRRRVLFLKSEALEWMKNNKGGQ